MTFQRVEVVLAFYSMFPDGDAKADDHADAIAEELELAASSCERVQAGSVSVLDFTASDA